MKRRPASVYILVALLVAVAIGMGVVAWREHVIRSQQERAMTAAHKALADGNARQSLALANEWQPRAREEEQKKDWQAVEISSLARLCNFGKLIEWSRRDPAAVARDEDASLLVARCAIHQRAASRAKPFIDAWAGKSARPEAWLVLQSDALLLAGKRDDARALLESVKYSPERDGGRKCRLAILEAADDPKTAWKTLTQAMRDNPRHAETRLFRGQFLEVMGRRSDAGVEYLAAHLADPGNPFYLDQLGEFDIRCGNPAAALEVWQPELKPGAPDFLWLKTAFWSRLVVPAKVDWSGLEESSGSMLPLARAIALQAPEHFWDVASLDPEQAKTWKDSPEVYWLSLLEKLQKNADADAWRQMQRQGLRSSSANPGLEAALGRMLSFRATGSLVPQGVTLPRPPAGASMPGIFQELQTLADRREAPDAALAAFLRSPEAVPALVAASGWMEAGVRLLGDRTLPAGTPAWARYSLSQAARYVGGPAAGLRLIGADPATPELAVLRGELLLAAGDVREARACWQKTSAVEGAAGERAAWFLASLALEENHPDAVSAALGRHAGTLMGRELVARAALVAGRTGDAARLYGEISGQSAEARAFLARQAMEHGDLATARKLANDLSVEFPDSKAARENMVRLAEQDTYQSQAK